MMSKTSLPQRREQRNVDKLLLRLSKMKTVLPKPAPITPAKSAIRAACTSNLQSFSRPNKRGSQGSGQNPNSRLLGLSCSELSGFVLSDGLKLCLQSLVFLNSLAVFNG